MDFIREKIRINIETLEKNINTAQKLEYTFCDCPQYKTENHPPKDAVFKKAEDIQHFNGIDLHSWLHLTVPPLKKISGKEYRLSLTTGRSGWDDSKNPQFTVYVNGEVRQALDINHTWLPLETETELDIYIYLYTGMIGGEFFVDINLLTADLEVEGLYYDLKIPFEAMDTIIKHNSPDKTREPYDNPNLPNSEPYDYIKIRDCLNRAVMLLDFREIGSKDYFLSIAKTREFLKQEFYGKICGNSDSFISCIGHTHIDVAWLWTIAQTREKAERSFSTVINMMDYYPEYKFMSSQPQLYQYVKEVNPKLYEKIKDRIKEGRWEAEGGMWLEADSNLTSGESLIRQFLYGKRFMQKEFGVDNKILWLPDVFGYSAALPQIMQKCGITQFFTTKINWNDTNTLPHDTFMWQGIDGSEVFVSMICAYVLNLMPAQLDWMWKSFKDKAYSDHSLMTFGYGDGGGGPTYEMMENFKRLEKGLPGMPKAKMETAGEFFDRQEKNFKERVKELKREPRWVGELYLEMHRGTYTTMAKNKLNNRLCEILYNQAESMAVADMTLLGGEYPKEKLDKNITNILLNQFHDIIPGSSIKAVYDVTDKEYASILKEGNEMLNTAKNNIKSNINTDGGILVFNPNPFEISDIVRVEGETYFAENIPPKGYKVIEEKPVSLNIKVEEKVLENSLIRLTFNEKYHLISVFDKETGREVLAENSEGNVLECFEDYPRAYDAWEINDYYQDKKWLADDVSGVKLLDRGIEVTRNYQNSKIVQKILLNHNSKRIDFETFIDWHEDHVLLKTAFPLDINTDYATYDIQFGNVKRPTFRNTPWDSAKFEVCGQKWADLSESGYGVSLLNNCKYGYSAEGNILKLSLLKAPTHPNPDADRGEHYFTYSLYPHTGDYVTGETVKAGYLLNMPLTAERIMPQAGRLKDEYCPAKSDNKNVVVETLKKAEDDGSVILRAYETHNSKSTANITVGFDFKKVYLCDMLENNLKELDFNKNTVTVPFKNFEIITLKFTF